MNYNFFGLMTILAICMLMTVSCSKKFGTETNESPAIDTSNFDMSVKPGDNFYRFVNGNWMKKNPMPAEESRWGAFNVLYEENQKKLHDMFIEAADDINAQKGTNLQKIGDFFASGMDTVKIEADGYKPLQPEFDNINNAKTLKDIEAIIAKFSSYGLYPIFYFYSGLDEKNSTSVIANISQGGLSMPDRDYYLGQDERSKDLREKYVNYIKNMFSLIGDSPESAEIASKIIMKIETQFAQASKSRVDLRDPNANYNKMSLGEVQKLTEDFDWNLYLSGIGLTNINELNVAQPKFLENMAKMLKDVSIDDWKIFLRWKLINGASPYLSKKFENEHFDFYGKSLSGTEKIKERWKRVTSETSSSLGEAVGELFVKKYFPPEAKQKMLNLVNNLKSALQERIKGLSWVSNETREKALGKLAKMNVKIGYPDKWRNYSSLEINRNSYVMNVFNASKFEFKRDMAKIGKPVDRTEWDMTPQTVNAYYNPNMNEIVFPAAILQPPFFNMKADDAVNYGGIGVVIGHEMTHGFDDQGRQYDAEGNLQDWWTAEDAKNFNDKVAPIISGADNYVELDSLHINGKLTLGENIADFGGLTIALTALKNDLKNNLKEPKIDGFTPLQRYFISFAQIWRQNIRDKDLMRRLKEDVHSPGDYRVNGSLVNVPEFYEAFGIKAGDKMFIPADKRAVIW